MVRGIEAIMIGSDQPRVLAEFYRDKIGLKITEEFEMDDNEEGFALEFDDGPSLYISTHSEVSGTNENPARIMLNFEVDDCEEACELIKKKGVDPVKDMYHVEGYGLVATFEDPDGNYFQFVQVRATDDDSLDDEEEEDQAEPNKAADDDILDEDEN